MHETLDYLFHQADIHAVAEVIQPIYQQLMADSFENSSGEYYFSLNAIRKETKLVDFAW